MKAGTLYTIAAALTGLTAVVMVAGLVPLANVESERAEAPRNSDPAGGQTHSAGEPVSVVLKPSEALPPPPPASSTQDKSVPADRAGTVEAANNEAAQQDGQGAQSEEAQAQESQDAPGDEKKTAGLAQESDKNEAGESEAAKPAEPVRAVPRSGHDEALEKKLTDILSPLIKDTISDNDKKNTKSALDLIRKDRFTQARQLYAKIEDADCKKLVAWYGMRSRWSDASVAEIEDFRKSRLDWPDEKKLRGDAEAALYRSGAPAKKVFAFFEDEPPVSGPGKTALARAYLASKQKDKAREIISAAWRGEDLTLTTEREIVRNFKSLLSEEDHRARLDRFVYRDGRKYVAAAQRVAKHLGGEEAKKARARIAVMRRRLGTAAKLIGALSEEAKKDPGVIFARARWARLKKKNAQAWEVLTNAPEEIEAHEPIDGWWKELRIHARDALNAGKPGIAYEIAKRHGPVTVNYYNDAEFMAGWLALRYLKKPEIAKTHFEAFKKSADGPRTRGKSNYWLGRAALAMKQREEAKRHFAESAKEYNTFYGQLSRQALDHEAQPIDIPPPPMPSEAAMKRFTQRESVHALIAAHHVGRKDLGNKFFTHLRYYFKEPDEMVLLAELAKQLDNTQQSIRIGKLAMFLKMDLAHYAYPTHAMPEFKPLRSLPERPFLFGIARQESEFNPKIVSHAGARGLMQVMPITARHVAQDHKIKYQLSRLISDPAYNATIASAYIGDRLDDFTGSYIMTMAGFNAGPGRVRQWVKQFGDPRKSSVDPIDWIERIPFTETRNYVLKVMANIQMYRARLGEPAKALRVVQDVYRSRKDDPTTMLSATN